VALVSADMTFQEAVQEAAAQGQAQAQLRNAVGEIADLLDHPRLGNGASSLVFQLVDEEGAVQWSVMVAREHHALPLYQAAHDRQVAIRHARLIADAHEVE
jgi:plasmid stabilization system protein ParE